MRHSTWIVACCLAVSCGDPAGPTPGDGLYTVLFYREDTGENFLLNSDGTAERRLDIGAGRLVPVGLSHAGNEIAFLSGGALVIGNLNDPGRLDTVRARAPSAMSLVAFSPDGQTLATITYGEASSSLLLMDRAGTATTIDLGPVVPVLPPTFSPDGGQVALVSLTDLTALVTVVTLDPQTVRTDAAAFSRFTYRPIFGWPRWTAERGLMLGTVRTTGDGDSVMVVAVDPAQPSSQAEVLYGVASPVLEYDATSTFALSADGNAVVVAALPSLTSRRRLYFGTPGGVLVNLLSDPQARPAFPLLLP